MPQSPRMQIHSSLSEKRGGVRVVGKFGHQLSHCIPIVFRCFSQIGIWVRGKALCQRLNVGLIAGRSSPRKVDCLLHGLVRLLVTFAISWMVVFWPPALGA